MQVRLAAGVFVLACGGVGAAVGQERPAAAGRTWVLDGLQTGFCVHFLIDSGAARELLPAEYRAVPAGRAGELAPALRQVVRAQPEYAHWIPSRLCLYYLDAVETRGRRLADRNPQRPRVVGLWGMTVDPGGGEERELALSLLANSDRILLPVRPARLVRRRVEGALGKVPERTDDRLTLRIGKARLIWDRHPTDDSTRVASAVSETWMTASERGPAFTLQLTLTPTWIHPFVGALKVEGKGEFAEAMQASPIRFVGPLYRGGGGRLRLFR